MRILVLCGDRGIPLRGPSGAALHLRAMAGAFAALGHEVRAVVARLDPPGSPEPLPPGVEAVEVPPRGLFWPLGRSDALRELRHGPRLAREALAGPPPDLIYERHSLFTDAGLRIARRAGAPLVLEHDAPLTLERGRFHGLRLPTLGARWEGRVARGADLCVAVSTPLGDQLLRLGVAPERILVEPNGIDLARFAGGERLDVPALEGAGPVLVFAGGFRPWHGLDLLPGIARALAPRLPGTSWLLVGDGPARGALQAELSQARAVSLGHLPAARVPSALRAAHLAVVPPPPEGLDYFSPLKITEAMAAGLPVIVHDRGDAPALIGAGGPAPAGVVVGGRDPTAWVEAIAALWADSPRRAALAAAGLRLAQTRTWTSIAARVLARALAGRSVEGGSAG